MGMQDILKLSVTERLNLIHQIWNTIDTSSVEISTAQKKELDKRMDRIANGETTFSTWADVKKRLRS
jgi:putative addiction module component (TIGR02574 family)